MQAVGGPGTHLPAALWLALCSGAEPPAGRDSPHGDAVISLGRQAPKGLCVEPDASLRQQAGEAVAGSKQNNHQIQSPLRWAHAGQDPLWEQEGRRWGIRMESGSLAAAQGRSLTCAWGARLADSQCSDGGEH